jgi:hypothetical protein
MTAASPTGVRRPLASLSIDLDDLWSYQMIHGETTWSRGDSYLARLVPHLLDLLGLTGVRLTCFVVGRDAARPRHREVLGALAAAGCELGNHSHSHRPWLHRMTRSEIVDEVAGAEEAIGDATGVRTTGFRGPGYSVTPPVLEVLAERGYRYDASVLPTVIGPITRAVYFRRANLDAAQRAERAALYGRARDGLAPLRPFRWDLPGAPGGLVEVPVTTFPGLRLPIHVSYLLALSAAAPRVARSYFAAALAACRARRVEPSVLLHPLDLLGGDDLTDDERRSVAFFPGAAMSGSRKRRVVTAVVRALQASFEVVPVGEHAAEADRRLLPRRRPQRMLAGGQGGPA